MDFEPSRGKFTVGKTKDTEIMVLKVFSMML
jgi:hypothetical protein